MLKLFSKFGVLLLIAFCLIIFLFQKGIEQNPINGNFEYLLSIIKNVITLTVSLMGLTLAYEGLSTWKEEISGKYNFELAKRMALCLNNINASLSEIGGMWSYFPKALLNHPSIPQSALNPNPIILGHSSTYEINITRYKDHIKTLEALLIETEPFFDEELNSIIKAILYQSQSYCFELQRLLLEFETKKAIQVYETKGLTIDLDNPIDDYEKIFRNFCENYITIFPQYVPFLNNKFFKKHVADYVENHRKAKEILTSKIKRVD